MTETVDEFFQSRGEEFGKTNPNTPEAAEADTSAPLLLDPKTPLESAKQFVAARYMHSTCFTMRHQNDSFYAWDGCYYAEISQDEIRAALYEFLFKGMYPSKTQMIPFRPNRHRVSDVLDALKAVTHLAPTIEAPAWIGTAGTSSAPAIIACRNGLLDVSTRALLAPTPTFYTHNALDLDYDPEAEKPVAWLNFLHDLWPEDPDAIDTLHEMFGYLLTAETRQQKAFLIVGPKRSGKGTIARVLTRLVGRDNAASPTTGSLITNFGMQPLIGKRLATISDARLSGRDQQAFAERLLSITGEDSVTIDRKYQLPWTGRLISRFLFLSNELPRLTDASGALVSRFLVLVLKNSFYGKEDHGLEEHLLAELPGILNLALEGWDRLSARGHFRQPASSKEAIQELEDLGSPISAFLRDRCIVGAGRKVGVDTLFREWECWCEEEGRDYPGTRQTFGRDLRTVLPTLRLSQPRDEAGYRVRLYEGLSLK